MHAMLSMLLALGWAHLFVLAAAELYVNHPVESTTCTAGQPCTVSWLDDGAVPLLPDIGACTVGLYHGNQDLVQTIDAVSVGAAHALQFTPQADAGPNSNTYYIAFTSLALANASGPYQAFSAHFTLAGMSGSFAAPVGSLTSARPVPSSVASAGPPSVTATSTVGTITGVPTFSSSPSGFSTVSSSAPSTSSTSSASSSSSFSTSTSPASTSSAAPTASANAAAPRTLPLILSLSALACALTTLL